ncbi:MAG: YicC family protein [Proteobacteria bacterium]|nr:YicC family protein [Pseudomonadota bacterium]
MIISMTGYACNGFELAGQRFSLEIKSYNHKYLDIIVKTPKAYNYLENQLRKAIGDYVNRGRIEFSLNVEEINLERYINKDKAKNVYNLMNEIIRELDIKESISLSHILNYKELLFSNGEKTRIAKEGDPIFWKEFSKLMKDFTKSRVKEGKELEKDIKKRLYLLEKNIVKIEKILPKIKNNSILKIKKKISEIFDRENISDRFEQEIVYMTEKLDVSEEITRFKAHVKNIIDITKSNSQVGKKLDFYTQELLREINTLTVKAQDAGVSKIAVDIKSEIEKIREQVQNVE